jgi:hypothetical protein
VGDEATRRRPSVFAQDLPREHEEAMEDRAVLCDCHLGPMYYFPVSLTSTSDFVMCWVSDCGRCYKKSLGYFRLRATRPASSRIDKASRRMARCPNQHCPTSSSMAVIRGNDASGGEGEARWHCFDCGGELPFHNFGTFCKRLLRSFGPSARQRSSVKG